MNISKVFRQTRPGSLHRFCQVPSGKKIPIGKLRWASRQTNSEHARLMAAKAALVLRFAIQRGEAR